MLDSRTKKLIDSARDVLVGKVPDPKAQVEQITIALIYKFMDDMDRESQELGGEAKFFSDDFSQYSWTKLLDNKLSGQARLDLYVQAITNMSRNPHIPQLFRDIFKGAFLPYNDPRTLSLFLKEINEFTYDHSENLGNAYEYLLSILGSQGDAGQFRTPRHIIDFIVEVIDPKKNETILDPACGTAGFLISAYKHILNQNKEKPLTPEEKLKLMNNIVGYDISPDMVRLALVNMYLHGFPDPKIHEYDTLSNESRWDEIYDVILANPPFMTPKGGISPHKRFSIQASRAEVLFVDYIAEHLSINGRAGIIVPEGIIFQSSNAYKNLRKNLIENWGLYAVVSLPSGVFQPYSGVKTSILFIDREFAKRTDEILFLKVENDGFDLGAQRRKIDKNDLPECLEIIKKWNEEKTIDKDSKLALVVKKQKIAETGDYNLTCDRYRVTIDYANSKWPMVELGEILALSGKDKVRDHNIPVMSITMHNGLIDQEDRFKKRIASVDISNYKIVYNEELVVGFPIDEGVLGFQTKYKAAGVSPAYDVWKLRTKNAYIPYLEKILRSKQAREIYKSKMQGSVSRRRSIPKDDFIKIKIPLPPLEIQEQIVAEIEGYQKIIDGAKQIAQNWKPKIDIDPKWPMVKLGEVFKIESGGTPDSKNSEYWNGDIKWATLADIPDNIEIIFDTKRKITEEGLKKSSAKLLPKGTILVSSRATIGRIAITGCEMATNQGFKNIIVDKENNSLFVAYLLSKQVDKMNMLASGGTFKEISKSAISTIQIPLPPLEIQKQIVEKIEAERELVESAKKLIGIYEQKIKDTIAKLWD